MPQCVYHRVDFEDEVDAPIRRSSMEHASLVHALVEEAGDWEMERWEEFLSRAGEALKTGYELEDGHRLATVSDVWETVRTTFRKAAVQLADQQILGRPFPSLSPTENGGLDAEWRTAGRGILIHFPPANEGLIEWSVVGPDASPACGEWRPGELTEGLAELLSMVARSDE